jgi:hypothetical protein
MLVEEEVEFLLVNQQEQEVQEEVELVEVDQEQLLQEQLILVEVEVALVQLEELLFQVLADRESLY